MWPVRRSCWKAPTDRSRLALFALIIALGVIFRLTIPLEPTPEQLDDGRQLPRGREAVAKPLLVPQLGHSDELVAIEISPNGLVIATGGKDNVAILWSRQGYKLSSCIGHSGVVNAVAFSPDSELLATASDDSTVAFWKVRNGAPEGPRLNHKKSVTSDKYLPVNSVVFSPDGSLVATWTPGPIVFLWDVLQRKRLNQFVGASHPLFSPDGRRVIASMEGGGLSIYDCESGKAVCSISGSWPYVFSRTGSFLCAQDSTGRVGIFDANRGTLLRILGDDPIWPLTIAISQDETLVAAGGMTNRARLWERETGVECILTRSYANWQYLARFSNEGRELLIGSDGGSLDRFDVNSGRLIWSSIEYPSRIRLSSSGNTAVCRTGPVIPIRDVEADRAIGAIEQIRDRITASAINFAHETIYTAGQDGLIRAWDTARGCPVRDYFGHRSSVETLISLPSYKTLASVAGGEIRVWNLEDGSAKTFSEDADHSVVSLAMSPDAKWLGIGRSIIDRRYVPFASGMRGPYKTQEEADSVHAHGDVKLIELATRKDRICQTHDYPVFALSVSPNAAWIASASARGRRENLAGELVVWETKTGKALKAFNDKSWFINTLALDSSASLLLSGGNESVALRTIGGTDELWILPGMVGPASRCDKEDLIACQGRDNAIYVWDAKAQTERGRVGSAGPSQYLHFDPDGRFLASGNRDGTLQVLRLAGEKLEIICTLCSLPGHGWAVFSPEGRFDAGDLDQIRWLHWVFPDEPYRPLPPEIYMRDYYEPRLLARILAGEKFRPIRPLAGLNRVQPVVGPLRVAAGRGAGTLDVTVEVQPAEGKVQRGGRVFPSKTVHDLRLFRDGQLVGQEPSPAENQVLPEGTSDAELEDWGKATLVRPGQHVVADEKTGRLIASFKGVQLPNRPGGKVEFSAYAFNADRVKSGVGLRQHEVPKGLPPAKPKAYLICVGVSRYANRDFDLEFAAGDARAMKAALTQAGRLKGYEPVPVLLTSDGVRCHATKAALRSALELLAGAEGQDEDARRKRMGELRALVPGGGKLGRATPDDLVLLSFSGHGFTDGRNEFYLLPAEVGPELRKGERPSPEALRGCISQEELSRWLRRVDAGEMALVIDACHSAATVEQPWFKPGPMGSRGLGQLAYDKRMRVLAASQADDFAVESRRLRQGLLTYALVRDGLQKGRADFRPKDGKVTLGEWLAYGAGRVPELHERIRERRPLDDAGPGEGQGDEVPRGVLLKRDPQEERVKVVPATAALIRESSLAKKRAFQTPALFDYSRGRRDVTLAERAGR